MSLLDELYQETILDHYQSPNNKGKLENPDVHNRGLNPVCGDDVEVYVKFDGQEIKEISFTGQGCSISQASASMMTEALQSKSLEETELIIKEFKHMMLENGDNLSERGEEFEDLEALEGVRKYPVRIKCAILAWNTLSDGLKNNQNN